jgi:hypothetical protein
MVGVMTQNCLAKGTSSERGVGQFRSMYSLLGSEGIHVMAVNTFHLAAM